MHPRGTLVLGSQTPLAASLSNHRPLRSPSDRRVRPSSSLSVHRPPPLPHGSSSSRYEEPRSG